MISEWRLRFDDPNLPFFLVQLAPYWEPPCGSPGVAPTEPCGIGTNFPHTRIEEAAAAMALETYAPTGYAITHVSYASKALVLPGRPQPDVVCAIIPALPLSSHPVATTPPMAST